MAQPLTLESAAFAHRGRIPEKYTCDGDNLFPPLRWGRPPQGTKSWALMVFDPDVPDPKAPQKTVVHMVLYNIPPEVTSLEEGLTSLPQGAQFGWNGLKHRRWDGPCPPKGEHRYFMRLYALDTRLSFDEPPDHGEFENAVRGHVLDQTELIGLYESRGKVH